MANIILCDASGNPTGTKEIVAAHTGDGDLHQAFSVCIFRDNGNELLLQKRAKEKMLFADLWANTCCSHPRETDEPIEKAGERRLQEECGFTTQLKKADSFVYRAKDPGNGVEHEHDTVLIGHVTDVNLNPDPSEIADMQWMKTEDIQKELRENPNKYAPWFEQVLEIALRHNEEGGSATL